MGCSYSDADAPRAVRAGFHRVPGSRPLPILVHLGVELEIIWARPRRQTPETTPFK